MIMPTFTDRFRWNSQAAKRSGRDDGFGRVDIELGATPVSFAAAVGGLCYKSVWCGWRIRRLWL